MNPIRIAKIKYLSQKHSSNKRNIIFQLSFEEWHNWWLNTGHYHERGRTRSEYCMCRFGDTGPYSLTNIYCDTNENNSRQNGNARYFKKHTIDTIEHFRIINSGINNPMSGRQNRKPQCCPVIINGIHYVSIRQASIAMGISSTALTRRLEKKFPGHNYA